MPDEKSDYQKLLVAVIYLFKEHGDFTAAEALTVLTLNA